MIYHVAVISGTGRPSWKFNNENYFLLYILFSFFFFFLFPLYIICCKLFSFYISQSIGFNFRSITPWIPFPSPTPPMTLFVLGNRDSRALERNEGRQGNKRFLETSKHFVLVGLK